MCVHTYRIYIRRAGSRVAVCGIHLSVLTTVTAIRAHVINSTCMYSCDQQVPKGHVLLAVIKPHVSHMYVLFVYKVKLKGSTIQTLMTSATKE